MGLLMKSRKNNPIIENQKKLMKLYIEELNWIVSYLEKAREENNFMIAYHVFENIKEEINDCLYIISKERISELEKEGLI